MTSTEQPPVRAELAYLAPGSTDLRQFIARGARIATERTEQHPVTIRDGRAVPGFALDVHGFQLLDHRSAVTDFTDPAQLEHGYVDEVCRFVQEQLGADHVVSRGWELRRSVAPAEHGAQPPACSVNVDYATYHVPGMVEVVDSRYDLVGQC